MHNFRTLLISCGVVLCSALNIMVEANAAGMFDKGGALSIDKPFNKGGALSINKPFDKGGALSIDKPFNKGGALSIDKPFNKGGALSIHKVYVPVKLRIGKVQTVQEVLIPVCWGRPQDCRGPVTAKKDEEKSPPIRTEPDYPYYIVGRFTCLDRKTNKPTGATCDITTRSRHSCAEAAGALDVLVEELWTEGFDACSKCSSIIDRSRYWDGRAPAHIQDGICRGK